MKSEHGGLRHFAIAAGLALLLYLVSFHVIESCRNAEQPWEVTFLHEASGRPALLIEKRNPPTASVSVVFNTGLETDRPQPAPVSANDRPEPQKFVFSTARSVPFDVPFGRCVFLDTTFLPGTVTLQCFGHEIEMIPRVLIIDHKEWAWTNTVINL